MIARTLLAILLSATVAAASEEYTWWVEDCAPATARSTGCEPGDPELAKWALEAWQRESAGLISLKRNSSEAHARLRLHWANGTSSLFGETQPILVDGKSGANIYLLPSVAPNGDPLLRETIVYLTCLHESGHALGMQHTRNFADIMYSFQYGGDISAYFGRYRGLLKTRGEIPEHSGVSEADRAAIKWALTH